MDDRRDMALAMDRLLAHGHAVTPQRRLVAQALRDAAGPISAQELSAALEPGRGIGQMTVYRTLALLADAGVAYQIAATDADRHLARYVFCSGSHHHHLVCQTCHAVLEVGGCGMESVDRDVEQRTGFAGVGHHLDFVGTCPACAAVASGEGH